MQTRNSRGFTIIELIVTMVILLILTTVIVSRLLFTQTSARDQERETDITALATGLEVYYQNGDPNNSIPKGYYPGSQQVQAAAATLPPFNKFLEGVTQASYQAPDRTLSNSFGTGAASTGQNADGSYDDTRAKALIGSFPYLYQPLKRDNSFCTNYLDCVKFNLYYLRERGSTEGEVIRIRSKNQ